MSNKGLYAASVSKSYRKSLLTLIGKFPPFKQSCPLKFRKIFWMSFPGFTNKCYQADKKPFGGWNQSATVNYPSHEYNFYHPAIKFFLDILQINLLYISWIVQKIWFNFPDRLLTFSGSKYDCVFIIDKQEYMNNKRIVKYSTNNDHWICAII